MGVGETHGFKALQGTCHMKRLASFFIIFLGLLLPILPVNTAPLIPIDAVLVLDVSLSMLTADPHRIANEAMNMFVGKLEPGRDRVGIVAYAGHITYRRDLTLLTENNVQDIQDTISGLAHGSWTDHPLGLLAAIDILYQGKGFDRQPMIIFLTDGNFNINPFGARTVSQGDADKAQAIAMAQARGIPIYAIGLNVDGALNRRYIDIVAGETGGLSFETSHAEELPEIVNAIFYLMLDAYVSPPSIDKPVPERVPPYQWGGKMGTEGRTLWPVALAAFTPLPLGVICVRARRKRVFTGRLLVECGGTKVHNLIEYGAQTTLCTFLPQDIAAHFQGVTMVPSPTAPSHLPHLVIRSKNPRLTFTQILGTHSHGGDISLSPGKDLMVSCDGVHVRVQYCV